MTMSVAGLLAPLPVVNDQIGPAVLPPVETAVTRQKYVVCAPSVPVEYIGDDKPVATVGGGFAAPNAMLNDTPTAPGAHPRVGVTPTPTAPSDGVGVSG